MVRILVGADEMRSMAGRPACLGAALARVRVASAVTQVDTLGRRAERRNRAWEDFVALAEPHLRMAVRACGCRARDVEECVQEAWLQVFASVDRVDTDPGRGSLACWLQTVARRSTYRFLYRQGRAAATATLMVAQFPWLRNPELGDPRQRDPAEVFAARETHASALNLLQSALGGRTKGVRTLCVGSGLR